MYLAALIAGAQRGPGRPGGLCAGHLTWQLSQERGGPGGAGLTQGSPRWYFLGPLLCHVPQPQGRWALRPKLPFWTLLLGMVQSHELGRSCWSSEHPRPPGSPRGEGTHVHSESGPEGQFGHLGVNSLRPRGRGGPGSQRTLSG